MPPRRKQSPCNCGWLQRAAVNPNSSIRFDHALNEYQMVLSNGASLLIDHCLVCGGRAPQPKTNSLLHTIKDDERNRLRQLTENLKTLDQVLLAFGEPDAKQPAQLITFKSDRAAKPTTSQTFPVFTYRNLSKVADVRVIVDFNHTVQITFRGKPVEAR